MSHAATLVPCLGTAQPLYSGDYEKPPLLDTKTKVILVVSALLAVAGLVLLKLLPPVGAAFLVAAGVGVLCAILFINKPATVNSKLEKLEKLEAAEQLAVGIEVPPALLQTLEEVIPAVDAIEEDDRIASIHYNCDETATFTLKEIPDLQFRVSAPDSGSYLGCDEFSLAERYENMIYAQQVCCDENYDSLVVPPVKPLCLKVAGLRRSFLVEKVPERGASSENNLEQAVRQMVQFLLKTGSGASSPYPIPFVPLEGGKLALQNLYHLTENPHPEAPSRGYLEIELIIGKRNSLLTSLDREDLIDVALDELGKLRPILLFAIQRSSSEYATMARSKQIQKAKEARLEQIRNPVQRDVQPESIAPPDRLGISPKELGLDLGLKDYAVIRSKYNYPGGLCRTITLGEVAQAIIDRINQKLLENPGKAEIRFSAKEMLIGEDTPTFEWDDHYQYNMLQGLGYKGWPDPNKEPAYWMSLVLEAIKEKGLIVDFEVPYRENPRLRVNLAALNA